MVKVLRTEVIIETIHISCTHCDGYRDDVTVEADPDRGGVVIDVPPVCPLCGEEEDY